MYKYFELQFINTNLIKLNKNYNNPRFYPRKFKKWSDEFDINLNENNELVIRRSDVKVGGWGESLIIDVEFDDGGFLDFVNNQKIPKVIYQTFETDDVPSGMYDSINSWINKNTDYEHYFFNHESRLEFIEKHFNKDVLDVSDLSNKDQYHLSDHQVRAILELRLQKLTAIGHEEINQENSELYKLIVQ